MIIASSTMIFETGSTKIFDVINERNCSDLANFNLRFFGTGVGANLQGIRIDTILQGIPVLCGSVIEISDTNSFTCYKFKQNGGWQEFVRMEGRRDHAAGIVYKNKFHVFGGIDTPFGSGFSFRSDQFYAKPSLSQHGQCEFLTLTSLV